MSERLGLPVMDGLERAQRPRQDPRLRKVHLSAGTGYAQEADPQRTQAYGFDRAKPIDVCGLDALLRGIT